MTPLYFTPLKIMCKLYSIVNPDSTLFGRNWRIFSNKEFANELIYRTLMDEKPCMIACFGSTELLCLTNYLDVNNPIKLKNYKKYIKGEVAPWWWGKNTIKQLQHSSGFFPTDTNKVEAFCKLMLNDIPQVNILGSWLKHEKILKNELENSKNFY